MTEPMSEPRLRQTLQEAISKLATLFEYGALMADTQPVEFIGRVEDEIRRLREENKALETRINDFETNWIPPKEGKRLREENEKARVACNGNASELRRALRELGNATTLLRKREAKLARYEGAMRKAVDILLPHGWKPPVPPAIRSAVKTLRAALEEK